MFTRRVLSVMMMSMLGLGIFSPAESLASGLESFKRHKCTKCHTLKKAGITKLTKAADDEEEGDDDEAPDGSALKKSKQAVGAGDSAALVAHLEQYLLKKVSHGTKKHKNRFKGSAVELKSLASYLAKLSGG
jgi:hypothetical protein